MCGRYVSPDEAALERFWQIDRRNWTGWINAHFNVAPTTLVPVLLRDEDGALVLTCARWGLIPSWWKKPLPPTLTFNARSEEAAQKPTWRTSMRGMRCLMPAVGWYEWNEKEWVTGASGRKVKQPYYIASPNSDVIAFAGLWALWQRPDAGTVMSCALLSREAAPAIAHIHHRMPVVLSPDQFDAWLDPATPVSELERLIANARTDFTGYPVSTRVNNTRNDSPELLEPAAQG